MRTILKGREPASLAEHRAAGGRVPDYESYRDKDTLRVCLVKEQRGLCCYCLQRIRSEHDSMKIEHWHCQAHHGREQLDYSNLLAACTGNQGQAAKDQHCDTSKGDRDLSRNPADPTRPVEDIIRFKGDGWISSRDPVFDAEINDVLNLNMAFLRNQRKETLSGFQGAIEKRGQLSRAVLERWLRHWNGESGNGDLEPFCQVVVYWLRKRLARA
jgi:uncharacterized protein (TIGR02646 family)